MPTDSWCLSVADRCKVYGRRVLANDRISLRVEPAEVYGLLGPNGAGKSTLVKQAIGLLKPASGSIRLSPYDLVAAPTSLASSLRLADHGAAVALVTNNVLKAEKAVDRLAIIDQGGLLADGMPPSFKADSRDQLRLQLMLRPGAVDPAMPAFVVRSARTGQTLVAVIDEGDAGPAIGWAKTLMQAGTVHDQARCGRCRNSASRLAVALRYHAALHVSVAVIPAMMLICLTSTAVGYGMGHAIQVPMLSIVLTQVLNFLALGFSPMAFQADQLPALPAFVLTSPDGRLGGCRSTTWAWWSERALRQVWSQM